MSAMGGGEKLTLALAEHLSLTHNVRLFCAGPLDVPSLEKFFGVDLSRIAVTPLNSVGSFWRILAKPSGRRANAFALDHYLQIRKLNLDIFINNSYASDLPCPAETGIFMCMFPHLPPRLHVTQRLRTLLFDWMTRRVSNFSTSNAVDSYARVVAISQYSAYWIRKRWQRDSEVIYPPCNDMGPASAKENMILHAGRFIADGDDERHTKRQEVLLAAFKGMEDLHKDGWELHFAGSVGNDAGSKSFAEKLRVIATGLPVVFHLNAAHDEIRNLYRRAAIYWHATGYGYDADAYPARQEHFGISTVEAMSAAAVPVVYSSGGQKEIVTDGVDGFQWRRIEELVTQTRKFTNDHALRGELGRHAVQSSKRFGREAFATQVDKLIAELLSEPRTRI